MEAESRYQGSVATFQNRSLMYPILGNLPAVRSFFSEKGFDLPRLRYNLDNIQFRGPQEQEIDLREHGRTCTIEEAIAHQGQSKEFYNFSMETDPYEHGILVLNSGPWDKRIDGMGYELFSLPDESKDGEFFHLLGNESRTIHNLLMLGHKEDPTFIEKVSIGLRKPGLLLRG